MSESKKLNGRRWTRGGAMSLLLATVALGTIATVGVSLSSRPVPTSSVPKRPVRSALRRVDNGELRGALARAGINPSRLAAAGVNGTQAASVIVATRQFLVDHGDELAAAESALAAASSERDRLLTRVQQGQVQVPEGTTYQTARANLLAACEAAKASAVAAQSSFDATVDSLCGAALASLSDSQRGVISTLRRNSHWNLALQYLATDRSDAEWVALRSALANQRTSQRSGQSLDSGSQARLADADAVAATVTAHQNLDANLASVRLAFSQGMATR